MFNKERTIWKTYPEIPFIEANQFGEIRTKDHYVPSKSGSKRLVKGHLLKQYQDHGGYMRVKFKVNGKTKGILVHRIVATCFLPNPNGLPEVNHIDCDRTNNRLDNLEWCTREYNIAYRETYGVALNHPCFAVDLKTLKVLKFESQHEAACQLDVPVTVVCGVIKGRINTSHDYWFTEDESEITEEKIREIKAGMHFLGGVIAINHDNFKVSRFKTQADAGRKFNISIQNIHSVLRGKSKTAGGHWFCYADENAIEKTREKFGDDIASTVEELMSKNNNQLNRQ